MMSWILTPTMMSTGMTTPRMSKSEPAQCS
jgi:hypothetical protein